MEEREYNGVIYVRSSPSDVWRKKPTDGGQQGVVLPPDPTAPFQAPRAQAETQRAQAQADTAIAQAPFAGVEAEASARKAEADARIAEIAAAAEASGKVKQTAETREKALKGFEDTRLLDLAIRELETLYTQGPGSTQGVFGVADFFGTPANKDFDRAGNSVRAFVKGVLQFTGQENNTPTEALMNFGPYVPQSADYDRTIEGKINALKRLRDSGYQRAVRQLGGVPDRDGRVVSLPPGVAPTPQAVESVMQGGDDRNNAMTQLRTIGGGGPTGAAPLGDVGSGGTTVDEYPPVMVRAHDDMVQSLVSQGGGRIDPQAYAQQRAQLFQQFNYQSDPQTSVEWATGVNQYLDAGGRTIPSGILPAERLMTATETMRNNLVNNPVGAAFTGAANAATVGSVQAFAPDEYMALGDAQPMSQLAGEIGGTIAGTAALGGIGRLGAAGVAPRLLGGGARGQFARNVATDAVYGGAFGGVTQGDPLTGAALGAGGSAAGQGVARGLGAAVGGAQRSAAVEALRARGVPISVGRQLGLGRAEDWAMSVPGVGDMIRRRQVDSFEGFDDAAMREAGQSIGFAPTQVGRTGVDEFSNAVSGAYGQAVQGVTAPLDRQFLKDMVPVRRMTTGMNQTNRGQLAEALRDAVQVPANAGAITPQQFQDAVSNLKALRSNAKTAMPNSAQTLRKAATQTINALEGAMRRAGGQSVVEGLQRANMANRGLNVIENAALDRGAVGTQAGAPGLFTPAQLLQSIRPSERRGFGDLPGLRQLGEQGQEVLPSTVPNSGTADRTLALGLMGGALGLGGGAEYASTQSLDTTGDTAMKAAGIAALAAILGTRRGQDVIEAGLFRRPQVMQQAGRGIRRTGGLFGSTGGAIALNQQ